MSRHVWSIDRRRARGAARAGRVVVSFVALAVAACQTTTPTGAPASGPVGPGATAQGTAGPVAVTPGVAAGRVTLEDGRPLEGATVLAIGVEYGTEYAASTDAGGGYRSTVEQLGSYRMAAWIETAFEGETFFFPLEPAGAVDTHFRGQDGIVKDFEWRLSGPASWASHLDPTDRDSRIGGVIGVFVYDPVRDPTAADALRLEPGSRILIELRPLTDRIDGIPAQPISVEIVVDEATGPYTIGEVGDLRDVPLAGYEASASLVGPDGTTSALVLGVTCTKSGCPLKPAGLAATAEVRFVAADQIVHSRPYQGQPAAGLAMYVHRD